MRNLDSQAIARLTEGVHSLRYRFAGHCHKKVSYFGVYPIAAAFASEFPPVRFSVAA
jgi:hypothetical protein